MPTLTDLPTELRQTILLAVVEHEARLVEDAWPGTIMALLAVCKVIRRDMPWVINCWSPLWWLQRPTGLTAPTCLAINGVQCGPKLDRLCISIFHDSVVGNIRKADWALGYPHLVHPELVSAWLDAVPSMPLGIATVLLDVTPAPGWMRKGRLYQLDALLLDNATARCFMNAHIDDISRLVERIHDHYAGKATINLTGRLSHKSDRFIAAVVNECLQKEIFVQYVGEYLQADQGSLIQIQQVVHDLAPKKMSPEVRDWQQATRLAPLRKVHWSNKATKLFRKVCDEYGVDLVREDMRTMAELMVGDRGSRVEMPPSGNLHRAMIHSMAQDMGLQTDSKGESESRYVAISKGWL